ncbi:MAG: TonB-dependent receptor [Pseudomonadota bacterium]
MAVENENTLLRCSTVKLALVAGASAFALSGGWAALAQEAPEPVEIIEEDEEEADDEDRLVVTGSRIRRNTFTSISPLQTITTEQSLGAGLIDPSAILQESTAAAGQQIDASFNGFVLDNGPGSQTLNLRGLGASRTLILINGRRMAPAGVEGAPTQPSINLLPGSLVDTYDLLLDGASSVYGSDAVAGVGNAILRRDFEGFEVFAAGDYNEFGTGNDYTISAAWGRNSDRGFIGVGAEFDVIEEVTLADRPFLEGCNAHIEETSTGEIRSLDVQTNLFNLADTNGLVGAPSSPCKQGGFNQRFFEETGAISFGSAYYVGGAGGNVIPGFSDTGLFGVPVDRDQNGVADIYFPFFSTNNDTTRSIIREQKKYSVMAYGEYTLEGEMNITPFFEALYVRLESNGDSGAAAFFPDVPANNPFNPCNPNQPNGFDCGIAEDDLLDSQGYRDAFRQYYANPVFSGGRQIGGNPNCFGFGPDLCTPELFGLFGGPVGPQVVSTGVSVDGDRTISETVLNQARFVAGVKGDIPQFNRGGFSDWNFEASLLYTNSFGTSDRPGIRDDRLALAVGWDPTTDVDGDGEIDGDTIDGRLELLQLSAPCAVDELSNPELAQPDLNGASCVPVNLFTDALLSSPNGQLTQAERDYLFATRSFDTTYEQTLFNAFIGGNIMELPAGALGVVAGVEYRIDSIDSEPDANAAEGLLWGFFADQGAEGEKWTREAFFEMFVPIAANQPLFRELNLEASARWTEDEFYGAAWTYSTKLGWRPFDPLLLKASYGTSFRAPNLRENFIRGQSGFTGVFDPCSVPDAAISPQPGGGFAYNPAADDRTQDDEGRELLRRCREEGRDPESVGVDFATGNVLNTSSVEVTTGGTDLIGPETSQSLTLGVAFEQPWFDSFDLNINVNAYDIEIEDSIIEPSSGFIVADCFLRDAGQPRGASCDRLGYGGGFDLIETVNASFINQDKDTVRGLDYNVTFSTEFEMFDTPLDFGINARANQLKERTQIFIDETLNVLREDFDGEFGFPEWNGNVQFSLDIDDTHRILWTTRYIGDVSSDTLAEFGSALGEEDEDGNFQFSSTCTGTLFSADPVLAATVGVTADDVTCRDLRQADEYFEHTVSYRYQADTWRIIVGVDNLFDEEPPLVDSTTPGIQIANVPVGNGYDLDGRQYFINFRKDFQ